MKSSKSLIEELSSLPANMLSLDKMKSLSKEAFLYFCKKRYNSKTNFDINEAFGDKLRSRFYAINVAGLQSNIEALDFLIQHKCNINNKAGDDATVLDSFMDACHNGTHPNFTDAIKGLKKAIDLLIEHNDFDLNVFDFNLIGRQQMSGLQRFLRMLEKYIDEYEKYPETEHILEDLIKMTSMQNEDIKDNYYTDYLTLLCGTVKYFNPKFIDLMMSKKEISTEDLERTCCLMCHTTRSDWEAIKESFNYLVSKHNMPIQHSDGNQDFISNAISYRHKPLFEIAVKNANKPVNMKYVLKGSLQSCFKPGLFYVKRKDPQFLIDNESMISIAGNVPIKNAMKQLVINAKYEMMAKSLNNKIPEKKDFQSKNKSKMKI